MRRETPAWHEEARRMKANEPGLTQREIGERLGRRGASVWKALNPERARELQRRHPGRPWGEWETENLAPCANGCGNMVRPWKSLRCRECYQRELDERLARAVELRREGLNNREVATRLGVTSQAVANLLCRARKADPSIPRSPYHDRGTIKAREAA